MQKKNKFEKGYLTYRKNKLWLNIFINIFAGFGIFALGLVLNKMQARNIFSVIALLFILPIGRSISTLFILLPFKEVEGESLAGLEEAVMGKGKILYSPVFTSAEHVMHFDLIGVFKGKIIAYKSQKAYNKDIKDYKKKLELATGYIDRHISNQGRGERLTVYEDLNKFIKAFPENSLPDTELAEIGDFVDSMKYFVV